MSPTAAAGGSGSKTRNLTVLSSELSESVLSGGLTPMGGQQPTTPMSPLEAAQAARKSALLFAKKPQDEIYDYVNALKKINHDNFADFKLFDRPPAF